MSRESVQLYWQRFLAGLPADSPQRAKSYLAEGWGDGPEMADDLGGLVARGLKTASCSSVWEWEAEGGTPPKPGDLTLVLDGRGEPLCIIETVESSIHAYNEVDAAFARQEGEGDLSLGYWRAAHKDFFTRTLSKIGREFREDMPLVCERFRLIHK